jgi:AraC-like DNA-binding protein
MPVYQYQEIIPHSILQDDVKQFWILEKEYSPEDNIEEVIPDACMEFILNFGSAYVQISGPAPRQLPNVCLVGLQSKPLLFQAEGVVKIVAIRFFAWGVLPYLQTELQQDSSIGVDLEEAWQGAVSKIGSQVRVGANQAAVQELEDFLIGRRLNSWFDPTQVKLAARLLYHTKIQFRVAELADTLNLSLRQRQRQFKNGTDISPKAFARAIRFEAIRNRLMFTPDSNMTDLSYEFGYTDQAHLINDFKPFTHKIPAYHARSGWFTDWCADYR